MKYAKLTIMTASITITVVIIIITIDVAITTTTMTVHKNGSGLVRFEVAETATISKRTRKKKRAPGLNSQPWAPCNLLGCGVVNSIPLKFHLRLVTEDPTDTKNQHTQGTYSLSQMKDPPDLKAQCLLKTFGVSCWGGGMGGLVISSPFIKHPPAPQEQKHIGANPPEIIPALSTLF